VFVHLNVLRRAGLASLEPDQHVVMTVITTEKGREATSIRLG
jgi:cold shock CspA family protein